MKTITVSREFGSGGRELGKRLADYFGFAYYDKEIIAVIAQKQGLNEAYVEKALEHPLSATIPLTFRQSFTRAAAMQAASTALLLEQKRVIEAIAQQGQDCVIVGRNADVLLQDQHPFSIFVCADMEAKIRRCMERAPAGERLSRREMEQNIRRIDKNRASVRAMFTQLPWGERHAYHLIVNTTDWNWKALTEAVASCASAWFAGSSTENIES